jgi:PKD repeat protein
MHGDEVTGYVLMLRYIDYLLSNYGTNERITHLLDNMEIWINPLANPDGTYITGNSSISGAIRNNANGKDLNRNYLDWKKGTHEDGPEQKETKAFCYNLQAVEKFTLAVNLHGGAAVCNYPWDNTYKPNTTADHAWWNFVCREYADTVHKYSPSSYMNIYENGVVYGADWYRVFSGRQDYANYYDHTREFCLEISDAKTPPASQLPTFWNYNYRSFLNYTNQALYGIHGVVTDACSGEPVYAKIFVNSHDKDNSFVMTDPRVGYYARPIKAGTYSLTYSADGYISQTISVTVADRQKVVRNIELSPTSSPPIAPEPDFTADKTIIEGTSATVQFSDLSKNCPDGWQWVFEGGTPPTSTEQNPKISYSAPGAYDVKLTATNVHGSEFVLKEDYIQIGLRPAADFSADQTTIVANNSVSFSDMSENEPTSWTWYFEGGTLETSFDQNPVIVYKNAGVFSVVLLAKNLFGQDEMTKEKYITVTTTTLPIADFSADKTNINIGESVVFTNLSENATTYEWYFEGGMPETSTEQNPTVLYETQGIFDVKLTVTNSEGSDEMLREDYIVVEEVAIDEIDGLKVKIFPNPVSQGATVTIEAAFPLHKIEWLNMSGAVVKTLFANDVSHTFSVSGIEQGVYLLRIETATGVYVTKMQIR